MTRRRLRTALAGLASLGLLALVAPHGGCNIVGPAAYLIKGPPKQQAQYELADVPTLVFVDDRGNVLQTTELRRIIADKVTEDLMVKEILTSTVRPQDAIAYARNHDTATEPLPIGELGERLDVEQMIYVEILSFDLGASSFTPTPAASCQVRVLDIAGKRRVFPEPTADERAKGRVVNAGGHSMVSPEMVRTEASRRALREALALELGDAVGKLFYKHVPRAPGKNLDPK